jgi:hypothetical protein
LRNLKFQEINQKAISKILKSISLIHFLPVVFCYAITRLSAAWCQLWGIFRFNLV